MRRKRRKFGFLILVICLIVVGFFLFQAVKLSPILFQLFLNKNIELKKASNERVNLLLLGIGGGTHDGPNLSDSIIFASINSKTNKVLLVSIPRDLWIDDLKAKINTAYAYGEEKQKGGGIVLADAAVSKVVGQPIDYTVRIDFAGFVKAVDMVGGIDVNVERTFDDYAYPITGKEEDTCGHAPEEIDKLATEASELEAFPCRYKHIHFDKGLRHFDGQTALEFVRSRHALGPEGTDFARSQRQEKVIQAFKQKVLSVGTLLNPIKLVGVYTAFSENIDTDIQQSEFDDFIKLAQKMKGAKISSAILDAGDSTTDRSGLLIHPDDASGYEGQWVLIPMAGASDYSEIHEYIACLLQGKSSCGMTKLTPTGIPTR